MCGQKNTRKQSIKKHKKEWFIPRLLGQSRRVAIIDVAVRLGFQRGQLSILRLAQRGQIARVKLEASPDFDDLMLLRQCDTDGRVPGAVVGTLDEALGFLRDLERANSGK